VNDGFLRCGYLISPSLLSKRELEAARKEAECLAAQAAGQGGVRMVLQRSPHFRVLAEGVLAVAARQVLGLEAQPVKAVFFDKTPTANWKVPWHQDLTIAVAERREVDGFGPWSVKDGVTHVQPPMSVLESIVAVRLHLDDTPAENGALRVLPGTHRLGRIGAADIVALRAAQPEVICTLTAGQALVMSPLLLHASSASSAPEHRRVLHVEYSRESLPSGLNWAA
jgi:ectoine hydroxylase-related dioxygenase (phytanoyl-CoA dioxygenase family)